MKNNNPLYYLPSSQLFPAPLPEGQLYSEDSILNELRVAKEFVEDDMLDRALAIYDTLIANNSNYAFLFACRSLIKSMMDEDEGAFYDYQVAKNMDFNYHHALEWIGNVGQMQESTELLDLIAQPKETEQYYINRATLLVQHFEYEKAVLDFSKAYSLSKNPLVLISRGAVNMRMVRYDKALADFNEALTIDSNLTQALILRAKLYLALHEYELAQCDFSKAIALDPNDSTAFEERAQYYESIEEYALAIADYTTMITLNEDDFYGYVVRADLYLKSNNLAAALADYDRAIALNPYYSDLYKYRGDIYTLLGDTKRAQQDFEKYEELEDE